MTERDCCLSYDLPMTSSVTAELSSAAVASVMSSNFNEPDVRNLTSRTSSSHRDSPNRFSTLNIFCTSSDPVRTMSGTTTPSHHLDSKTRRNSTRPVSISTNIYGRGGEAIRNASHPIMLPPITATTNAVPSQSQRISTLEYFQPTSKPKTTLSFAEVAAATGSTAKEDSHRNVPSYPSNHVACWVVLNGQRVLANDLIGLRVAKTFVGHGRFLGQVHTKCDYLMNLTDLLMFSWKVIKFDEGILSYTISYADGDQEVLSIEDTIQILVQDDVERPDPKAIAALRDRVNDISGMETAFSTASMASLDVDNQRENSHKQVTEREAQFVQSLFETEALPVLLREGWRLDQAPEGAKQHYIAPSRDPQSTGLALSETRFTSPLQAVEYIASDPDLLRLCFPPNVHGAILSLFSVSNQEAFDQYGSREIAGYRPARHTSTAVEQHVKFDQRTCHSFPDLRTINTSDPNATYIRGMSKNMDYVREHQPNLLHSSGCTGGSNQGQMDSASFYRQMKVTPTDMYSSSLPTTSHTAPGFMSYNAPNRQAFNRDISMQDVDRHGVTTTSNPVMVPSSHSGTQLPIGITCLS